MLRYDRSYTLYWPLDNEVRKWSPGDEKSTLVPIPHLAETIEEKEHLRKGLRAMLFTKPTLPRITAMVLLPRNRLAIANSLGRLIIWDTELERVVHQLAVNNVHGYVTALLPLPGNRLVAGYSSGDLAIWHLSTGKRSNFLKKEGGYSRHSVTALATWRGNFVVGHWSGTIEVRDLEGKVLQVLPVEPGLGVLNSGGLLENGDNLLFHMLTLHELVNDKGVLKYGRDLGFRTDEGLFSVLPDGRLVTSLSVSLIGRVNFDLAAIRDSKNPAVAESVMGFRGFARVHMPDGRLIAADPEGGLGLFLYNVATKERELVLGEDVPLKNLLVVPTSRIRVRCTNRVLYGDLLVRDLISLLDRYL